MSTSYKLSFVPQTLQLHAKAKFHRNNHSSKLYAVQDGALQSFDYVNNKWEQTSLLKNVDVRALYTADLYRNGKPMLIVKTDRGMRFYRQKGDKLELLLQTDNFEDDNYFDDKYYEWDKPGSTIKMGNIYTDSNVGIVGKRKNDGMSIFAIMKDLLESDEYPIKELDRNLNMFGDTSSATIALSDIKRNGHENIIVHGRSGLSIYEINRKFDVERQMQVPNSGKVDDSSEELFFPNLTGQSYRDIVSLNDTGLFVYQYNKRNGNYQMINYAPSFSKLNGWRPEHRETVHFEDIDLDGRPDMIFTGPQEIQALSFDTNRMQWKSLLDNSKLSATQRHGNVMKVIRQTKNQHPLIVTKYQDRLYAAKIEAIRENRPPPAPTKKPSSPKTKISSPIIPQMNKLLPRSEWSTPQLQDQLDYSEIYKAIGNTGTPSFHLPLVDLSSRLSNVRFEIVYDGSDRSSDLLSVGWSSPRNFITVVSPTIFPEDDVYYLMFHGSQYPLIFKPNASNDDFYSFETSNKRSRLTALYHRNEERWEVKSKDSKQIYGGRRSGAITWSQREHRMRNERDQRYANVWHLVQTEDSHNNVVKYAYESVNVSKDNGKKTVQELYVKTVNDMNGNQITFNYANRNRNEYESESQKISTRSRYLTDYTVTTATYQQTVKFVYEMYKAQRYLTKIQQVKSVADQSVLEFAYVKVSDAYVMHKITLPSKASIVFESQLQKTIPAYDVKERKCDVEKAHRVDYGNDYIMVSYLNVEGRAVVRIYNPDMTEELYSPFMHAPDKQLPFLGEGSADSYGIFMFQHFIAIVLTYGESKEVHLLRRDGKKWITTPKLYKFDKNAEIQAGKDFVAVADVTGSVIEAISWNSDDKRWDEIRPFKKLQIAKESLIFAASNRMIVNVEKNEMNIAYKNVYNQWQNRRIKNVPNVVDDINKIMQKFDIEGEPREFLFQFLKSIAIKVSGNFIALNRWQADGMKLKSEIDVFVLNSDYNESKRQNIEIPQDDLATFTKDFDDQNGSTYVIGFKHHANKFKTKINEIRGKKLRHFETTIDNRSKRKIELNKFIAQEEKGMRNLFPLEVRKYIVHFISQSIVCNNKYYTFNGDRWTEDAQAASRITTNEKNGKFSIPIDKKLVLHKPDAGSSIRLHRYKNDVDKLGAMIVDLNVQHLNQTVIKFPSYLAYKPSNQLNVIQFANDGSIARTVKLPASEFLTELGSTRTLVTRDQRRTGKTLIFRHQYDIDRHPSNVVTTQTTVILEDGMKRVMGYEYGKAIAFGEMILYEKIAKIPNNKKSTSGWTEETFDFKKLSATDKFTYNSNGELVRTLKSDEKPNQDAEDDEDEETRVTEQYTYEGSTMSDRTGMLPIAQAFPHRWSDDDVGYIGFEDYERASTTKWEFDARNIVKNEFSFTGQNFLRLTNATLKADFRLADKNQPYVVSSWIRTQNAALGQTIPYIKAVIPDGRKRSNDSFSYIAAGEIKFQVGAWYYAEAILNVHEAREALKAAQKSGRFDDGNSVISVMIVPNVGMTIDVDHIRFAPLSNIFAVNVYNPRNFQLKEVIGSSGLVERHMYDKYLTKIATVSEYGELIKLETYTKTSSISRMSQPKSRIEIKPQTGFYEHFAPESFHERWSIENGPAWRIAPGQLEHITASSDAIKLSGGMLHKSQGVRFLYSLQSKDASIQTNNGLRLTANGTDRAVLLKKERAIPSDGELLIITEGGRMFVWIDGGLYFDTIVGGAAFDMTFQISGKTKINDLMVFYNPSVTVSYVNSFDEKLQEIAFESENASMVTGYRYDALGRQTIVTRPMRIGSSGQSLLAYDAKVVGNSREYSETQYCNNPLNDKCAIGLPGHRITSAYTKRYSYSPDDLFIKNQFPVGENYSYQVEHRTGDVKVTSVYDNRNNRVAWYLRAPKANNLYSTYKYDKNGKLVQMLPPAYHATANTFHKIVDRLRPDRGQEQKEKLLQDAMGVNTVYDERGRILSKTTPDAGRIENVYNGNGMLAFVLHYSNGIVTKILYYDYDNLDRLRSNGEVTKPVRKDQLLNMKLDNNNSIVYQQFSYNDFESNPLERGRLVRTVTFNHGEPFIEESLLNIDEENISKRVYTPNDTKRDKPDIVAIDKIYRGGKLNEIRYPVIVNGEQLRVTFEYDKLGNVIGIGVPDNANRFVRIAYNPDGQISGETFEPSSVNRFSRQYNYDSSGFLTGISDPFLTENLRYTDGYGSKGYSDGMITRTQFNAQWHDKSHGDRLGLNENSFVDDDVTSTVSSVCFNELKRMGYLNKHGRQARIFYPNMEPEMPILCRYGIAGRRIQNVLGQNGFATQYGHSYDYGNYQELAKAKYFVGDRATMPLQADSFAREIPGIDEKMSRDIWNRLTGSRYLIDDNHRIGSFLGHGKRGKSFINASLHDDLRRLGDDYNQFGLPLENLLTAYFSKKRSSITANTILKWNIGHETKKSRQIAERMVKMLNDKGYAKNPLAREFADKLKPYQPFIHDIVRVLFEKFSQALGETEFDTESYKIDENGNHRLFYTGFDRYEIDYNKNTNQISNVTIRSSNVKSRVHPMKHDHRGNVIQALHKGIQRIDYNPVSNRATKMQLVNGSTIKFHYDAKGERVLKKVFDRTGKTTKEIHYTRDEFGRALVERQVTYVRSDLPPDVLVTAYIYGPKGLIGFIRRDQFYSVIKDHEGSVRLVVKNNEVVAAYDYLPYGDLMRKFAIDPNAHISYRYTGQEWDDEIGLYNYHARFYDPSIGRFYQIDPLEQYFSPYKYAGNSPVMMVDPDGKFAFLILFAVVAAVAGAYLGGAAANGSWNPVDWDWASRSTWFGIFGGGIAGAMLPFGAVGSVGALSAVGLSTVQAAVATAALGIGVAYVSVGASTGIWDPTKWDYSSPETWNAIFQGFATGTSLPAGVAGARLAFVKISSNLGKGLFIVGTASVGTGYFTLNGFNNNWDFSDPAMYLGLIHVIDDATNIPAFFRSSIKSIGKSLGNIGKSSKLTAMAVTKLAAKGFALTASAVILTAYYEELDLSDPMAVFSIIRQMSMVNMHYSLAKGVGRSIRRKYRTIRKKAGEKLHGEEHDNGKRGERDDDRVRLICKRNAGACELLDIIEERYRNDLENEMKQEFDQQRKRIMERIDLGEFEINYAETIPTLIDKLAERALDSRIQAMAELSQLEVDGRRVLTADDLKKPSALAIGLSDRFAVASFSGLDGMGLMFVYAICHYKGLGFVMEQISGFVLKKNNFIVKHADTIPIGDRGNILIEPPLNLSPQVRNFLEEEVTASNLKLHLDPVENQVLTGTLDKEFRMRDTAAFDYYLNNYEQAGNQLTVEARNQIRSKIQSGVFSDQDFAEIGDFIEGQLRKAITEHPPPDGKRKVNLSSVIPQAIKQYHRRRKEYFRTHVPELPYWPVTNCAEIHVVTGYRFIGEDLVSLSTYKVVSMEPLAAVRLDYFEPCPNCVLTTQHQYPDLGFLGKLGKEELRRIRQRRFARYEPEVIASNLTASEQSIDSRIPDAVSNKNVARTSNSALDNLFNWMGRVGGLINNWIDGSKNSSHSGNAQRLSTVDTTQIDQNGTILLLDMLIRKFTAQKYNSTFNDGNISEHEARGNAIELTAYFEELMDEVFGEMDMDFSQIQAEIFKKIQSCKHNEIGSLLRLHMDKVCRTQRMDERVSSEKIERILATVDEKLNLMLTSC